MFLFITYDYVMCDCRLFQCIAHRSLHPDEPVPEVDENILKYVCAICLCVCVCRCAHVCRCVYMRMCLLACACMHVTCAYTCAYPVYSHAHRMLGPSQALLDKCKDDIQQLKVRAVPHTCME